MLDYHSKLFLEDPLENFRTLLAGDTPNIDVLPFGVKQKRDMCGFHSSENDDLKCKMDISIHCIVPTEIGNPEIIMHIGTAGEDTSNINVLPFGVKQECNKSSLNSDENDDFKCKMDIKDFSLDIIPTEAVIDIESAGGSTSNINVLPLNVKKEYMPDFPSSENGEMDITENFSIYNAPTSCYRVSSDFKNGKFNIDDKHSKNQIPEISERNYQTQGLLVKYELSDSKLLSEETMTDGDVTKFQCHLCEFSSENKYDLQRHNDETHLKHKKFKCHLCEYRSSRKSHLERHVNGIHLNIKKFKCHLCEHSSADKGTLQRHIHGVHFNLKKFKCHFCDHSSADKGMLQRHIDGVHLNLKKFKCHLCEYNSVNKGALQRHIDGVHLNIKKFKCHLCEYSSVDKGNLHRHIDGLHLNLKKFKCDLCDYNSVKKGPLQRHINEIHEELKKFECHLCKYKSVNKSHLQRHINGIHLELRKFKCHLCEHSSGSKSNLQKHIDAVHFKLKKYMCPLCGYRSGQKNDLQVHINGVHLKL